VRRTVFLLLALAASTPAAARSAAAEEVDARAFITTLETLSAAIERATPEDVTRIITTVPSTLRVRTRQQVFDVRLEPIAQSLARARSDPSRWAERRTAILSALRGMTAEAESFQSGSPDTVDLHRSLDAVLARREFTHLRSVPWTTRLRDWVTAAFRRVWKRVAPAGLDMDRLGLTLAWLAALFALSGIAWFLYRTTRRSRSSVALNDANELRPLTPAREWALRALAAARDGQTSEAVRCAYRAAVQRLEEQGTWRVDESRTAREYARLLEPADARRVVFHDIVRQFERTVYANSPGAADEAARLIHDLELLGCVRAHETAI